MKEVFSMKNLSIEINICKLKSTEIFNVLWTTGSIFNTITCIEKMIKLKGSKYETK